MKRSEAAKLVALLRNAFPSAAMSEGTSQVYEGMLLDLDFELGQKAVARLIGSSRFLPTIAEIRECAAELQVGALRPGGDAWGDVLTEIRRVGYMDTPHFADPIVTTIVKRWGWRRLCLEGNDVADRARFVDLYDRLAKQVRLDFATGIPLPEHRPEPQLGERQTVRTELLKLGEGIG